MTQSQTSGGLLGCGQVAAALPSLARLTRLAYTRGFPVGGRGWERGLLAATSGLKGLRSLQLASVPNRGGAGCRCSACWLVMLRYEAIPRSTCCFAGTRKPFDDMLICVLVGPSRGFRVQLCCFSPLHSHFKACQTDTSKITRHALTGEEFGRTIA